MSRCWPGRGGRQGGRRGGGREGGGKEWGKESASREREGSSKPHLDFVPAPNIRDTLPAIEYHDATTSTALQDSRSKDQNFSEMCSGSEKDSYVRLKLLYRSTVGLRVIKKKTLSAMGCIARNSRAVAHDEWFMTIQKENPGVILLRSKKTR